MSPPFTIWTICPTSIWLTDFLKAEHKNKIEILQYDTIIGTASWWVIELDFHVVIFFFFLVFFSFFFLVGYVKVTLIKPFSLKEGKFTAC